MTKPAWNNTAYYIEPYFLPPPVDLYFFAGDSFDHSFGVALGQPGNSINVVPSLGAASRFLLWDSSSNSIKVYKGETSEQDVRVYPLSLNLTDQSALANVNLNQTYKDKARVTYHFTLTVYQKVTVNGVPLPPNKQPDVRMATVLVKYKSDVIDVREFDKNSIKNATDTTLLMIPEAQVADPNLEI